MKWFNIFKNRAGKLTINLQSAIVLSVGIGVLGVSLIRNVAEQTFQKELAARSVTSISNAYNYGGLRQTKEGLSSMNIANLSGNLDRVATAEERARFEAARTGNGQFGLDAADNMAGNVSAAMSGVAAQTSDTEGLGMGKNAVVMQNETSGSSSANMPSVSAGAVARQGQKARAAGSSAGTLTPSAARMSGGGVSNASFGGGSSVGAGASGSSSKGEGYRLSGAMPSSTNPVSMHGADGRSSSGFMAGGRHSSSRQGGSYRSTGNELKDISRHSAKIAANSHRAANAGSDPFLASSRMTGGMSFENGVEETTTGSSDFEMQNLPKQKKAIESYADKTNAAEEERHTDRSTLLWWMAGVLGGLVTVVPLACKLLGSTWGGGAVWKAIVGYTLLGLVLGAIAHMLRVAYLFRRTYDSSMLPTICDVFGAMSIGLVALAVIPGSRSVITKNIGAVWKYLLQTGISLGASFGLGKLQQAIFNKK